MSNKHNTTIYVYGSHITETTLGLQFNFSQLNQKCLLPPKPRDPKVSVVLTLEDVLSTGEEASKLLLYDIVRATPKVCTKFIKHLEQNTDDQKSCPRNVS